MTPQCLQSLCQWLVCIKTGMVFPTQSYFRVHSRPFVVLKHSDFVCFVCFVVQVFPDFVSIRVHSWFKYSQISCPFVSIRGSDFSFRVFRVFRGSLQPIRVHSWDRPAGFRKKSGFWRDGTFFPEYIKSAMDPRGFSSKTATLQQG